MSRTGPFGRVRRCLEPGRLGPVRDRDGTGGARAAAARHKACPPVDRYASVAPSAPGNDVQNPAADRRRRFGEFLIERELGRGGMGVVLLATQESMGRKVAIKMLPSFAGLDPAAVGRFRREAEATGRLSHPGIVPVHSVGEHDGTHYFVMDYVEGPPLDRLLDALRTRRPEQLRSSLVEEAQLGESFPTLREAGTGTGNAYVRSCARLIADVANALGAAHRERIVHRDLKPNNILIHPAGRPVLVDFGLARDEQSLELTKSGEQVGTPAYMAPEQAAGGRTSDARVDI
jgi:serine/threonine protein kinase